MLVYLFTDIYDAVTTKIAFANFIGDLTDAAVAARDAKNAAGVFTKKEKAKTDCISVRDDDGACDHACQIGCLEIEKRSIYSTQSREKNTVLEAIGLDQRIGGICLRCVVHVMWLHLNHHPAYCC